MKAGKVVERFSVKDKNGKVLQVLFRFPKMNDAKEAARFINKARDEALFLGMREHENLKSERKFLFEQIKNMRQRKGLFLFVIIDAKIVGDATILPHPFDATPAVGEFGIILLEQFTELGIGSKLVRKMIELAKKKTRFKIIQSAYFAPNKRSKRLHVKFGFKRYGRLPKGCKLKDGKYCDHMFVYKVIKKL